MQIDFNSVLPPFYLLSAAGILLYLFWKMRLHPPQLPEWQASQEQVQEQLVHVALQQGGRLSALDVVLNTSLSLPEALEQLDVLEQRGLAYRESHAPGSRLYLFPDAAGAQAPHQLHQMPMPRRETAERRVLELVQQQQGRVNSLEMSRRTGLKHAEIQKQLDQFVEQGVAALEVDDKGALLYYFPDLKPTGPQQLEA